MRCSCWDLVICGRCIVRLPRADRSCVVSVEEGGTCSVLCLESVLVSAVFAAFGYASGPHSLEIESFGSDGTVVCWPGPL